MQADVTVDNCAFCVFYPAHAMVMLTVTKIVVAGKKFSPKKPKKLQDIDCSTFTFIMR